MALQYVGGATATKAGATTGNSTISLTSLTGGISSSAAAGDIVVAAFVSGAGGAVALDITDGTNAYTLVVPQQYANGSTYDTNLRVAYKVLTDADASVTFGPTKWANDAGAMAVHVWRGVDTSTPLDVAAVTATGNGTGRPNPAAITPTTTGAVIIAVGGAAAATGAVFTSSDLSNLRTATSADTNDAMIGIGSKDWTSGSFDPAQFGGGTTGYGDSWCAVTLALRPAATQTLTPSLYSNGNTFYATTLTKGPVLGDISGAGAGTDSISTNVSVYANASSEVTTLSDTPYASLVVNVTVDNKCTVIDTFFSNYTSSGYTINTVATSDTASATYRASTSISETVAVTHDVSTSASLVCPISETASTDGAASSGVTVQISTSDSFSAADLAYGILPFTAYLTEAAGAIDGGTSKTELNATISELFSGKDSAVYLVEYSSTAFDTAGLIGQVLARCLWEPLNTYAASAWGNIPSPDTGVWVQTNTAASSQWETTPMTNPEDGWDILNTAGTSVWDTTKT